MLNCKNMDMTDLAENILRRAAGEIDHPVVDATGLQGGWDFVMGWSTPGQLRPPTPQNQPPSGTLQASDPAGGISVFDAVQKQLGLKLVKQTHSYPVWVVDHIDEKPID
jgi:uncharacterized protein (TIGR03435 family)